MQNFPGHPIVRDRFLLGLSVIGEGTTFHITLKLEVTYLMQKVASNPLDARKLPFRHVLLAEDNPVNQMVAKAMLTRLGLQVSLVGNGRQAVEAVSAATFDLILLDLEMPVMNGYEAAKTLRKELLPEAVPLLALTANVDEDDRVRALACGFDRVLHKPLDPEYLLQVLTELAGERAMEITRQSARAVTELGRAKACAGEKPPAK